MKKILPVIDMHVHLRDRILYHTNEAKKSGIDVVVYMANTDPVMDTKAKILASRKKQRACLAIPVSAITYGLKGKKLVDVDNIRDYVAGFSDDGKNLNDLALMKDILQTGVLVMAHCEPETEYAEKYINLLTKYGGRLHIQHVSKKETVNLIRDAKKHAFDLTCETCPHYFTYTANGLETKVNPPLGKKKDLEAIEHGLADGTIDVIASDYAPKPRKTGIASFKSFLPLCYGLVTRGVLKEYELKQKISDNPSKIILLANFVSLTKQ